MNFARTIALLMAIGAGSGWAQPLKGSETLGERLGAMTSEERAALARLSAFMVNQSAEHSESAPLPRVRALLSNPTALELDPEPPPRTEIDAEAELPGSLRELQTGLGEISMRLEAALSKVESEVRPRVEALLPGLIARSSSGSDLEEIPDGKLLAAVARDVDPGRLARIASVLASWAEPAVAERLAREWRTRPARPAPRSSVEGEVRFWQDTPNGAIVVGGPGPNRYFGGFRLIIDLGGADRYQLASSPDVRMILDLGGDDEYAGLRVGGAVFGASLLYDVAGNDRYLGGTISQGAAVAGVAMLVDDQGDDLYWGTELVQGAALAGIGILTDRGGHDRYHALRLAQGFGGARGFGTLNDEAGDDEYVAGFAHPSSYGVENQYQAFAQGAGLGYRHDIAGGIGMLRDRGGNDRYRAGNYSQGAGYYFGLGKLLDDQGDDRYMGARYSQGAAAHLGIGILHDREGDDHYHGLRPAAQAGAWDLSLAVLLDDGGDDDYQALEFSQAAAAQAAIAILIDETGRNCFRAARHARGHLGPEEYHATSGEADVAHSVAIWRARSECDPDPD